MPVTPPEHRHFDRFGCLFSLISYFPQHFAAQPLFLAQNDHQEIIFLKLPDFGMRAQRAKDFLALDYAMSRKCRNICLAGMN